VTCALELVVETAGANWRRSIKLPRASPEKRRRFKAEETIVDESLSNKASELNESTVTAPPFRGLSITAEFAAFSKSWIYISLNYFLSNNVLGSSYLSTIGLTKITDAGLS
jgi:hypothetical protein